MRTASAPAASASSRPAHIEVNMPSAWRSFTTTETSGERPASRRTRSASWPSTAVTRATAGRCKSRAAPARKVSPCRVRSPFGPPMRAPRPAARITAWMRMAVGTSGIITLHGMKQKHLVSLRDYTRPELEEVFELARRLKADPRAYANALRGKSLAMIFQKPSTRTRVSFEVGMFQLGGHALHLGANEIQIGRGETLADTAKVLSRYVDGIMARVYSHEALVEMSRHATVPVINGLSDLLHPVQALADFFTMFERRGRLDGVVLAYVGDGNNMCQGLMSGAVKLGVEMRV